jgi:Flp pilus assembly protein CpaB
MSLGAARYRLRLAVARHRRPVLAGLVAAAAVCGLQVVRPAAPATRPVTVVTRDLPAGHVVAASDVVVRNWPVAFGPSRLVARPVGRVLSGAVLRGEPLTDARVAPEAGGRLAGLPPDAVSIAVRLADPAAAVVARPGGRVDVIVGAPLDPLSGASAGTTIGSGAGSAADPQADRSAVIVSGALVVAVGHASDTTGGSGAGGDGASAGDTGVLGGLGAGEATGGGTASTDGAAAAPQGVLVLAVARSDAVRLAKMAGIRRITITAPLQTSAGQPG